MMEWERPYMEACIDTLDPCGDVLEIGFGCGYSAGKIQDFAPKSHTIIEYHPVVAQKAREWAKDRKGVQIVEGTWQEMLGTLGRFDAIFFDDYPLESDEEMQKLKSSKGESEEMLGGQKALFSNIFSSVPGLASMKYGDADLEMFFDMQKPNEVEARYFLDHLKKHGNIDESQYTKLEKIYCPKKPEPIRQHGERLFTFLNQCIANHMNPGARFSCFFEDPTSKKNDPAFAHILNNPKLTYKEKTIPINVPSHCAYYKSDQALIPLITYNPA
ncbi:MAG: class I SAM-dependent methyltransferase [Simkaniaceae bacterium]|nr:class I SAM-dependent methyltransferase [Simkaniaceae bacterium]